MMMRMFFGVVVSFLLAAGCDPLGTSEDRRRQDEERVAEHERAEAERVRQSKALTDYAQGKAKLLGCRQTEVEGELKKARADVEMLSQLINAANDEKTANGQEAKAETKLLRSLRSPEINALAKKWLAEDFTLVREEYAAAVRKALEDEARYRKAISQGEANYQQTIAEANQWTNATREQRDREIERLLREIASLESQRKSLQKDLESATRKTLVGNRSQERERADRVQVLRMKIYDRDDEIRKKRAQVDYLRSPAGRQRLAFRSTDQARYSQQAADNARQQELYTIDRYYKPVATVAAVVGEYLNKSVMRLQSTIAARVKALEEERENLGRKVVELKEILLAIPTSSSGELNALRSRIDKVSVGLGNGSVR